MKTIKQWEDIGEYVSVYSGACFCKHTRNYKWKYW